MTRPHFDNEPRLGAEQFGQRSVERVELNRKPFWCSTRDVVWRPVSPSTGSMRSRWRRRAVEVTAQRGHEFVAADGIIGRGDHDGVGDSHLRSRPRQARATASSP